MRPGSIFNFLRKQPEPTNSPSDEETAFASGSLVFNGGMFMQYNPDELIGRKGFSVYKKMMTDEQVKAVVRFHRDAITGRAWSFEDNPSLSDSENEKRRDVLTGILNKIPGSFKTKLDMVMSSLYNGFSITEKTFELVEVDGKTWTGVCLSKKPFETFFFNLDDYGKLESFEQDAQGNRRTILDIGKFIHHVQNADVHEYYGQSELREAYRAWWSKDTALILQNIWLERTAAGFAWAAPTAGKTLTAKSPEYAQLKTVLQSIRSSSSLILPSGIDFKMEQPSDTQAFERSVQGYDKAIAKSLLMPNLLGLSEQGPNGSRALGDTQLEAFLWMLDSEAQGLQEVINEQLIKDLARYNFPDGKFPMFKLHELSDKKAMEIVDKWAALVTGNAVKSNSSDEAHIRRQLGFPEAVVDEEESSPVDPATALSGIQVSSMMEVIDRVATEKIPRDTGIQILINSFPINLATAELIMGEVGKGFKPKEEEKPVPQLQPGQPGGDPAGNGDNPQQPDGGDPQEGDPPEGDPMMDETILGRRAAKIQAAKLTAAKNRVAFAVLDSKSKDIEEEAIPLLSALNVSATVAMLGDPNDDSLNSPEFVQSMKYDGKDVAKLKAASKAMLTEAWSLGVKHAKDETSKAAGKIMSVSFARLDQDAGEFFDAKSFTMAGKLTADMLAIAQNIISNAIKTSASRRDTIDMIYEAFAREGFISPSDAQAEMKGILEAKESATARLNTVVRTNTFEAINEARYSYFTDPELASFVEALEYTAILDSRTTQICQHLDGQVHSATGEVWNGPWRPPNHFNCRSLLIPVTQFDAWSEDPMPEQQPQAGFGGRA